MASEYVFVLQQSARGKAVDDALSAHVVRAHVTRQRHAKLNARKAMQNMQPWSVISYKAPGGSSASSETTESPKSPVCRRRSVTEKEQNCRNSVPILLGGGHRVDPFKTSAVDQDIDLAPIIAHYIEHLALDIPDLDGPGQRGLLRRIWFPFAMTDPALMYGVLLVAAAHFYSTVDPSQPMGRETLLYLKARTLESINEGIAGLAPSGPSDALIGAVAKVAAFEAIFGDPSTYATHMHGLKLMIQSRGGLESLGLDGLLERMVVWIDLNASHLTGLERVLGGPDLPTCAKLDVPDPRHFTGFQ